MNRQVLLRKIMDAGDEVRRLEQVLVALQSIDIVGYPENYSSLAHQAIIKSEYLTRKLRELVYNTTNKSWSELLETSADEMGIIIDYGDDGIVNIEIPCLIPKRKKKPTDFITAPLYATLERFIHEKPTDKPFVRFENCVICITHIYDEQLVSRGRKRDYDNIETKGIIDVINAFLLKDDNGFCCKVFQTSEISDRDYTRIFIMKVDMFFRWVWDMKID